MRTFKIYHGKRTAGDILTSQEKLLHNPLKTYVTSTRNMHGKVIKAGFLDIKYKLYLTMYV